MKLRLGMSPISWSNDDLPQLGGDTPLSVCLSETRQAGYTGTETGGKFPKQPAELASVLADHDLALVSGWYSGTLIQNDLASEIDRITPQLDLFAEVGAAVLVYGETHGTVQNQQDRPLATRPKLADFDVVDYGRKADSAGGILCWKRRAADLSPPYGHGGRNRPEIDQLMAHTGEAVGYCWIPGIWFLVVATMVRSLPGMAAYQPCPYQGYPGRSAGRYRQGQPLLS